MEQNCAFCDRSKFAGQLIAETEAFYVIASLGQITDGGYVLIVPKQHITCIAELPMDEWANTRRKFMTLVTEVAGAVETEYRIHPMLFEHGKVGQSIKHAHLHLVPAAINLTVEIRKNFPLSEIDLLRSYESLFSIYRRCLCPDYLFWQTAACRNYVCWEPQAPKQYLRTITAKLLGRPERADWRKMDPELDKRLVAETVARLKPHFA